MQDYGTDYTATGVGDPSGGNIILTTPIAPGGATVLIKRIVPLTQMTDYVENDALPAEVLERGFDKQMMGLQQLQSAIVSGGGGAGDEALLDAINAHISDTDSAVHAVSTHIGTHSALATGVHGVGASTVETVLGSQNKVNSHAGGVDAHAATALATAGRIVYRDVTTGRAAIATGSAASDIANTGQVTAVSGSVTTHAALTVAHGATDAATPDRIVLRDAAGTSNFSDATSASHPATWGQANTQIDADVAAHSALTLGVHGSASQLANINDISTHNNLTDRHGAGGTSLETVLGSQAKVDTHNALFDRHGATAANTVNTPIRRDASGNAKVSDGVVASDIATKGQVDTVGGSVTTHAALTTGTHGVASGIIASTDYVDAHKVQTSGVHGVGASTVASVGNITTHAAVTTGVHGVGASTVESIAGSQSKVDTHSALTLGVHGSASQLANINDIADHNALTDRHGTGGSTIASVANIATHAALTTGVHGAGASTLETIVGSQNKVNTHAGELDAHAATAAATAGRIVFRDITTGRAAISDGSAAGDIATVGQITTHAAATTGIHGVGGSTVESATGSQAKVDTHAGLTGSTAHSATAAATANRIMLRDASGRSAVATGSAAGDIANTGQITTHSNLTTGIHGATATPTANRIPIANASGSLDAWVSTIGFNNMLHVRDVKSTGTAGGTFTSGAWRKRDLNTVVSNSIAGASLASSQITLPAGTYYVSLRAPANKVDAHQIRWQNVTDSTNILFGSNAFCGSAAAYAQTDSMLFGVFTLAATKNIELQHQCATSNATNGFGRPTSWGDEVYSEVVVFKI